MDAERADRFKDPNELFVNAPEGAYGPSGYTEMNLLRWINSRIAALFRSVRRRRH